MDSMPERIHVKLDLYASSVQCDYLNFLYQSELILDGVR